ncbi:MAG: ATP-dependent Clp protease proteolytic subunit, partial [Anaerolineae bacterium]
MKARGEGARAARRLRLVIYILMVMLSLVSSLGAEAQAPASRVEVLTVTGAITPIIQGYIIRGIEQAEADGAAALVIQLDTPGGSVEVTKAITQRMLAARVPVVVFVAPAGAHAASAGTFIALAAHIAAMAPGTSIGAASPVSTGGEELPETSKEKAIAILEADLKGLARRRGEKAVEWAGQAVREAKASTAEEVLGLGVIDLIANDIGDLLTKLDGRQAVVAGETITLHTA